MLETFAEDDYRLYIGMNGEALVSRRNAFDLSSFLVLMICPFGSQCTHYSVFFVIETVGYIVFVS